MYYFCYISNYKVEQYLAQLAQMGGEMPSQQVAKVSVSESTRKAEGRLGPLAMILSLGGTYGRSDKIETRSERRTTLIEKLLVLLEGLYADGRIGPFTQSGTDPQSLPFDMYFLRTEMRVETYDSQTAILKCENSGVKIELSCSMRYFSEYFDRDGAIEVHSGNYHFFNGDVFPTFDAVIIPIERRDDQLFATPLFLALNSEARILI